jgi:ATP-binding cassette subfamily B protein RaxB
LGRPIGEASVVRVARLGPAGITLAEFARLASSFGLRGAWYGAPVGSLRRLPRPFVAHLTTEGGHFVVVHDVSGAFVTVADPARGLVTMPLASFQRAWSGRSFLLLRARAPIPPDPRVTARAGDGVPNNARGGSERGRRA